MIDNRFSSSEFEKFGRNSKEANLLHKKLAYEIAQERHEAIYPVFEGIASKLKALGHELIEDEPEYDPEYDSWEYAFRDLGEDRGEFDHKLRVHLDTQICTGYPNYQGVDQISDKS